MEQIFRGDIVYCKLNDTDEKGVQSGERPCLVLQNDIGNKYAPTTVVAPLSKKVHKKYPFHVELSKDKYNLRYDSIVLCEQPVTISKTRINRVINNLTFNDMERVNEALRLQFGI